MHGSMLTVLKECRDAGTAQADYNALAEHTHRLQAAFDSLHTDHRALQSELQLLAPSDPSSVPGGRRVCVEQSTEERRPQPQQAGTAVGHLKAALRCGGGAAADIAPDAGVVVLVASAPCVQLF